MKSKKILALALAAVMALSVAVSAASFPDVDASTAEGKAIVALADMGVLGGFEDGTFGADKTVTRAQFAKIMYALKNDGATDASAYAAAGTFTDVTSDKWFAGYVNWCASQNIVGGVGDGKFDPDSTLTMAQAVKMYAVAQGGAEPTLAYPQGFIDFASEKGYFADVADFQPNDAAPRGVIALIGYNTLGGSGNTDTPAENLNFTELAAITAVSDSEISMARILPTALPTKIDMTTALNMTTISFQLADSVAYPLSADVVVKAADGQFTNNAKLKEASISDVVVSDGNGFYTAEYTVTNGKVTELNYFKTLVPMKLEQRSNGYLALPANMKIYAGSAGKTELALGTFVEAGSGTGGKLTRFTQPQNGVVTLAASGKAFRLDFESPAGGLKKGDTDAFLFVAQTNNLKTSSVGVVNIAAVDGTTVPDKQLVATAGE